MSHYYHAGFERASGDVEWSNHTRRTREAAAKEAVRMGRGRDGKPLIEWWEAAHGMRPGSDVASGAAYVAEADQ